MALSIDIRGGLRLRNQLNALRLTPTERMQINRAMGRKVASYSKKRIQTQTDLDGAAFAARKRKPIKSRLASGGISSGKNSKMLAGLKTRMKVYTNPDNSTVTWSGGKVAYKQQYGCSQTMTAKKLAARKKKQNDASELKETPSGATVGQALALLAAGYRIPRHRSIKGNSPRPSKRWIVENLTYKQAGKILRLMRFVRGHGSKRSWTVKLPSRSFLGTTAQQEQALLEYLDNQITDRINKRG